MIPGSRRYTIKPSKIHGLGVHAVRDFAVGDPIGVMTVRDHDALGPVRLIRTELGRFINHSRDPNSATVPFVRDSWILVAIKPIHAGDEITCSYCDVYETYRRAYGSFVIPPGYIKFRKNLPEEEPPGMELPECPHWSTLTEKRSHR